MDSLRFSRARALACVVLVPAAVGACGTVWGFQPATLETEDASLDGTTQNDSGDAGDSTRPADSGSAQDAPGVDSTGDVGQTETSIGADSSVPADSSPPQDATSSDTSVSDSGFDADAQRDTGPPPPSCGDASVCAPTVAGWTGPVAMYQGSAPPPTCTSPYGNDVYDGNLGLDAGPATCADCTCTPKNATCAPAFMGLSSPCGTACGGTGLSSGACASEPGCGLISGNWYASVTAPAVNGGSCTPDGGGVAMKTESWSTTARACALPSDAGTAECPAGDLCVPNLTLPFNGICVFAAGTPSCPAGYNGSRTVYFSETMDTRGCDPCQCGPITGTCSGTIVDYVNAGCSGTVSETVPVPSQCTLIAKPLLNSPTSEVTLTPAASCLPTQLVPSSNGTDIPTFPTTVCCL